MDAHGNKTPICYHVYQRSNDGGLLVYCAKDFLVTYTIVSVCARKRGIIVLGFCQMFDHIHGLFVVQTPEELSDFVRDYSAMIAREFNRATGRTGPVLEHSFGRAAKVGDKKIRTALAYLYCGGNQLTSLDVSKNTALTGLNCTINQINEIEMGKLVESLPANNGKLYVKNLNISNEQNVITTAQVAAAKAKGWTVYAFDSSVGDYGDYVEYDGDAAGIPINSTTFPDENFRNWVLA